MAEELIKINPMNLPYLYRFTNEFLTLDASSVPNLPPDKLGIKVNLYPKNLVLSVYQYSLISYARELDIRKAVGLDRNYPEAISCGYLSLFKPVEVPKEFKPKIMLRFVRPNESDEKFKLEIIELDFGTLYNYTRYGAYLEDYYKRYKAEEHLIRLKRIEGKNFNETFGRIKSKIANTVFYFEMGSTLIGNLLYSLHKGDFVSDVPLDSLVETVRNQGDNINDVIENAILVIKFSYGDPLI